MFFKEVRTLRISSLFVKSKWKKSIKPRLILSGDWLAQAGFNVGEQVTITVNNNQITIAKDVR